MIASARARRSRAISCRALTSSAAARATDLVQDAQLLLRREGPPAGALGQPGIARRRRRDNGRSTAFCHAGISGGRRLGTIVGHDHETFSRTLKLKLRGNSCLIIIGVEGLGGNQHIT